MAGTFGENGGLHAHRGSSIDAPGDTVPAGAYRIAFLLSNPGGAATSDPLYIVYNDGLSEETHDAAIAATEASLVPEPASLALLVTAGLELMRQRRAAACSLGRTIAHRYLVLP